MIYYSQMHYRAVNTLIQNMNTKERKDYTEVYAWGSNNLGQLGILSQGISKSYSKPKFYSFNIVIKEISCGNEHTALITSIF